MNLGRSDDQFDLHQRAVRRNPKFVATRVNGMQPSDETGSSSPDADPRVTAARLSQNCKCGDCGNGCLDVRIYSTCHVNEIVANDGGRMIVIRPQDLIRLESVPASLSACLAANF
jgi:hypothetical protein